MASNVAHQRYTPGKNITCKATQAVTGRRFVAIDTSGVKPTPNIKPNGAGVKPFGVAVRSAAVGDHTGVYKGGVTDVDAGAALTAGQEVESDAQGRAIPLASGKAAGRVVFDAANGTVAEIDLY